jgi:hypothetical protein
MVVPSLPAGEVIHNSPSRRRLGTKVVINVRGNEVEAQPDATSYEEIDYRRLWHTMEALFGLRTANGEGTHVPKMSGHPCDDQDLSLGVGSGVKYWCEQ